MARKNRTFSRTFDGNTAESTPTAASPALSRTGQPRGGSGGDRSGGEEARKAEIVERAGGRDERIADRGCGG